MRYRRKASKKGSLSLSMEAIVILILAITLLGLGLSFMRGLFKQIGGKVAEAVSANELVNPPTVDNPITVAPSEMTLRQGEDGKLVEAFLNVLTGDAECNLRLFEAGSNRECLGDGQTSCDIPIVYNRAKLNMKKDQINTWTVGLSPRTNQPQVGQTGKTFIYTSRMECDGTGSRVPGYDPSDPQDSAFSKDVVIIIKP